MGLCCLKTLCLAKIAHVLQLRVLALVSLCNYQSCVGDFSSSLFGSVQMPLLLECSTLTRHYLLPGNLEVFSFQKGEKQRMQGHA